MFRRVLKVAGVTLVLFHVWLLGRQLWDGHLADVGLLGRWLLSGGLLWGLVSLRRQGAHLFLGRRAVAIWLLAAILHGPAVADRADQFGLPPLPDVVTTLSQAALGLAAVVGLVILTGLDARRRRTLSPLAARFARTAVRSGLLSPDTHVHFAPRPPPSAQFASH